MSKTSDQLTAAFIKLSSEDQQKMLAEISTYVKAETREKQRLHETFAKRSFDLGPLDSGPCPVCGRR
jgi:hypothetical protein